MKAALKRIGSAPKLRLPSSKSSGTLDDGMVPPEGVAFQATGALISGVELGGEPNSNAGRIMLLEHQLREKTRRLEEAERQLIASTPSRQIQSSMKTDPPLPAGATSAEALAWLRAACNRPTVNSEVFKMLLLSIRDNPAYLHLWLPRDDEDLFEYAARMHMLGDVDRDDMLSDTEFDRLWEWVQQGNARAHRVSEGGTEHGVLGQRFGSKFVAPVDKFVFGSRADWEGGLLEKLEHGALIKRSVEAECTSHGSELKDEYYYIVKQRAKHKTTPHGEYDLGHDGLTLKDFLLRATERGATLTLVEVAVLRMYTTLFYRPWNNALRGLDPSFQPDDGASLKGWATCIAVLFSAVMKLSGVASRDAEGSPIKRVWRGVDESERELPDRFLKSCKENQGYPGGAEQAFSSTTTDPFTAHNFSGGWRASGTILEIDFGAGSRGADVSFLSCYPLERELLLPPFCMFSTHGAVQRGPKRYIRCSIEFNPTKFDLDLERISDVPKLRAIERVTRARRNTYEAVHEAVLKMLQRTHPGFFDPFSQGQAIFVDPVVAEDGHTYERKYIEQWIEQHIEDLISPYKRTSMGPLLTPNTQLKHTIADALAKQHAEMKAVGIGRTAGLAPSQPVELKRVDELGEIFEQLDALGDILPASMESWQMPSFVVLGAESSGKSTLLERVSMFSMFPRADGKRSSRTWHPWSHAPCTDPAHLLPGQASAHACPSRWSCAAVRPSPLSFR